MTVAAEIDVRELLGLAAAWRLASLLLERPRPEWRGEVAKLSSEVTDGRLSASARGAGQGSEEIYHRLFGPGGAISPREVSYCGFEDPGRLMAELGSFYHAFSFEPRREDPIDHIAVEAGFVGYLFLKEAYARLRDDVESAEVTKDARERFSKGHAGRCARGMAERLGDAPPYLRTVLSWLAEEG